MSALTSVLAPVRRAFVGRVGSLRAAVPPVAVEIGAGEVVLARVRRARRKFVLEALEIRPFDGAGGDRAARSDDDAPPPDLAAAVRGVFAASDTRPGKLSLVLPDSLAKVSVLGLPERPTSVRQLTEMVRFKLRRTVPFRLEDAAIAHQLLPDDGGEPSVLVAVVQRSTLDSYEKIFESIGARAGMIGIATVQLFNLLREPLAKAAEEHDAALLNCAPSYFSLLVVRRGKLIFYRCKPYGAADDPDSATETMARELASSFSYYEEKLAGRGVATVLLRTVAQPVDEVTAILSRLGVGNVEPIDLARFVTPPAGKVFDDDTMHRVAPAVAATVGGW